MRQEPQTKRHVIVVDDDASLTQFVEIYMNRFGYQCCSITDPSRVMPWLELYPCDLVILDLQMPKIDGLTLLREIRSKYPNLTVVIFSGLTRDEALEKEVLEAGASCFIPKSSNAVDIFTAFMNNVKGTQTEAIA